ncbi:hypothetical protein ACFQ60_11305 [Streptomyces zhihengii]
MLRLSGALGELTAGTWAEFTHAVDAEVRASFDDGVVRSWPAVTRRGTGSGTPGTWRPGWTRPPWTGSWACSSTVSGPRRPRRSRTSRWRSCAGATPSS